MDNLITGVGIQNILLSSTIVKTAVNTPQKRCEQTIIYGGMERPKNKTPQIFRRAFARACAQRVNVLAPVQQKKVASTASNKKKRSCA